MEPCMHVPHAAMHASSACMCGTACARRMHVAQHPCSACEGHHMHVYHACMHACMRITWRKLHSFNPGTHARRRLHRGWLCCPQQLHRANPFAAAHMAHTAHTAHMSHMAHMAHLKTPACVVSVSAKPFDACSCPLSGLITVTSQGQGQKGRRTPQAAGIERSAEAGALRQAAAGAAAAAAAAAIQAAQRPRTRRRRRSGGAAAAVGGRPGGAGGHHRVGRRPVGARGGAAPWRRCRRRHVQPLLCRCHRPLAVDGWQRWGHRADWRRRGCRGGGSERVRTGGDDGRRAGRGAPWAASGSADAGVARRRRRHGPARGRA